MEARETPGNERTCEDEPGPFFRAKPARKTGHIINFDDVIKTFCRRTMGEPFRADGDKIHHKSLYLGKQTSNNCTFIYLSRRIVKQWLIYAVRHLAIKAVITRGPVSQDEGGFSPNVHPSRSLPTLPGFVISPTLKPLICYVITSLRRLFHYIFAADKVPGSHRERVASELIYLTEKITYE